MADEDRGNDKPSLELPSLRFGRKKKQRPADEAPSPAREVEPTEPAAAGGRRPDETQPLPAQPRAAAPEAAEPRAAEPPAPQPDAGPPPPVASEPPAPQPDAGTPPPVASEPVPAPEAPPLFVDEAPTSPLAPPTPASTVTTTAAPVEVADPVQRPEKDAEPRERRQWSLPAIGGMAAAMITGVLVGVFTVGLVWASAHLCEVVRGTSSCGGPGYLMLLAIVVAMVLLGAVLLRAWGLPDPSATSFLAVGLMGVLALLMVDLLFHWWMIIVIPAVAAATFAVSHWITAAFTEPVER